jgi:DNA mismatch repair protein MutL
MASVSHFVLRTRQRGAPSGTELRVNGGVVASERESAAAEGTVVEVNDIFYNLPARRKFLKSDAAESAQVSKLTTQLALAYPEVGFTLTSAGRTVLQCPPAPSLHDRLYQLYGERDDLIEVHKDAGGLRVFGYVAALAETSAQGPTRGAQHLFVNRRIVKDRTIAHAIIDAYSRASIKERSPEVHLFLEMPPRRWTSTYPTKPRCALEQSVAHEVNRRALGGAGAGRRAPAPASAGGGRPAARRRARDTRHHSRCARRWKLPQSVAALRSRWREPEAMAGSRSPDDVRAGSGPNACAGVWHAADDPSGTVPRHVHHRHR